MCHPTTKKYLLLCIAVIGISNSILGQTTKFSQPSSPGDFFDNTLLDIVQDHQGFMWIGTTDGLGRYDGKEVLTFNNIPGDSTSITNNYTSNLHVDSKGNVWVGTKRGLNCYDPKKGTFNQYFYKEGENFEGENYILSIREDRHGYIWFGTYNGLFRLDPNQQSYLQFLPDQENAASILDKTIFCLHEDHRGRLWIGTSNGLAIFDNDDKFIFKNFDTETVNSTGLNSSGIFSITEQTNGTIWFASYDGFYRVNENSNGLSFQEFIPDPSYSKGKASNMINHISAQGDEKIWLSMYNNGLGEVKLPTSKSDEIEITLHQSGGSQSSGFAGSPVHKTLIDLSGNLWVATTGTMNQLKSNVSKFHTIIPNATNGLKDKVILSMLKDSKGNLWVGGRNGLNFISAENLKLKNYQFLSFRNKPLVSSSLSNNKVYNIYEDSNGWLWVSTLSGLNLMDLNTFDGKNLSFKRFSTKDGLPHDYIEDIEEISPGKYWVCTYGQLSKMSIDRDIDSPPLFQNFDMDPKRDNALVNATTYQVAKDRFGQYWVATFLGLSKIESDENDGIFVNYKMEDGQSNSLSDNSIICLFLDSKGRFWVGTRNGLNLLVQKDKNELVTFKNFGIKDGFTNTVIKFVQEDGNGLLWVGTNNGFFLFDPEKALTGEKGVIRMFNSNDGMSNGNAIRRCAFMDENQNLFFGSANGINYIHPNEISYNPNLPTLVITRLKVLNETIFPTGKKNAILKNDISLTENLTFNHTQNIFLLEFAALEFTSPEKNQFAYQLEGFNKDWVYCGSDNTATYTNLPPGNYTFKIKASNNDGIWNESPKELFIKVLPPPWQTWWAYTLYGIAGLSALFLFIRISTQRRLQKIQEQVRINKARDEERELLRKKNAADFHDELGHRITKIALFVELAERQLNENSPIKNFLHKVKNNTRELSEGIKDLIWSLDPDQDSIQQTLSRLQEFGDRLFDFTSIKFKTKGISSQLETHIIAADKRKQLLLIFKEAMNNCLKYSKAENALLKSQMHKNILSITFQDDGIGMSNEIEHTGYGLKNMQERAQKIGAVLEIISEPNHGTTVRLKLKIPHMG